MNKQQRKLKKHPLIRFVRGIFRLIRVILNSGKNAAELERAKIERAEIRAAELERAEIRATELERAELERAELERAEQERDRLIEERNRELAERYITVGELFNRVEWKDAEPKQPQMATVIQGMKTTLQADTRPAGDVSLN